MAAPVCNIAPPPPTFDSTAPQLPSIPLVSINPQNWNIPQKAIPELQLLATAINSLRTAVNGITNSGAAPNNFGQGGLNRIGGGGGAGAGGPGGGSNPKQKQKNQQKRGAGLKEIHRVVKKVKIVNPDDNTQYVTIKQITQLTFRDPVTGLTWVWNQGNPGLNVDSSST